MAIPTTIEDLSTTPDSNGPSGSEQRTLADDGIRHAYAFIRMLVTTGSNIASASSITPPSTGSSFNITGTTTIAAIASTNSWNGRQICLIFAGALQLTHSSNFALPGSSNITTAANDIAFFIQTGSGAWRMTGYLRADGTNLSGAFAGAITGVTDLTTTGNAVLGNATSDTLAVGSTGIVKDSSNRTAFGASGVGAIGSGADQVAIAGTIGTSGAQFNTNVAADYEMVHRGAGGWWFYTDSAGKVPLKIDRLAATNTLQLTSAGVAVGGDGRLYGLSLHNNAGAVTGTTNQYIASGTYTPTLTSVANISATTARQCQWMRVGNVVTVSGQFDATHTATGTVASEVGVSLPIASSFTTAFQAGGTANSYQAGSGFVNAQSIDADATNDRARVRWMNAAISGSTTYTFSFSYEVL